MHICRSERRRQLHVARCWSHLPHAHTWALLKCGRRPGSPPGTCDPINILFGSSLLQRKFWDNTAGHSGVALQHRRPGACREKQWMLQGHKHTVIAAPLPEQQAASGHHAPWHLATQVANLRDGLTLTHAPRVCSVEADAGRLRCCFSNCYRHLPSPITEGALANH